MVIGPIAAVANMSGVTDLQLSPAILAGIFAGKIHVERGGDQGRQP